MLLQKLIDRSWICYPMLQTDELITMTVRQLQQNAYVKGGQYVMQQLKDDSIGLLQWIVKCGISSGGSSDKVHLWYYRSEWHTYEQLYELFQASKTEKIVPTEEG